MRGRLRDLVQARRRFGYRRRFNETVFTSMPQARAVTTAWVTNDNTARVPTPTGRPALPQPSFPRRPIGLATTRNTKPSMSQTYRRDQGDLFPSLIPVRG